MQYTEHNVMEQVLVHVPGFRERWDEHVDYWDGEPAGLTLDMIEFAAYATDLLEQCDDAAELEAVFELIERLIVDGNDRVRDAATAGFLESIVNPVTEETPYLPQLAGLLGERSLAFCRAWLEFAGGDLPGLSDGPS